MAHLATESIPENTTNFGTSPLGVWNIIHPRTQSPGGTRGVSASLGSFACKVDARRWVLSGICKVKYGVEALLINPL
jgi:hypothetical protein